MSETLQQLGARLARETDAAYRSSPYVQLSQDYLARYGRDPAAVPAAGETVIAADWRLCLAGPASPLAARMAGHLQQFLAAQMGLDLPLETTDGGVPSLGARCIELAETGGGDALVAESFSLEVTAERIGVRGRDAAGLRDGIVRLVDLIGLRQAPFLAPAAQVFRPRLTVRLGTVPIYGSYRDLVFLGYNAVFASGGDLYAVSRSNAIPALTERRGELPPPAIAAREYGLKTYAFLNTRQKFPADHPVFSDHPDIRGALTWSADGEYTLCTEHPLVRRYLQESVEGLFRHDPDLDGVVLIIGGEGFYHCFMRPYGVEKGHTNCPRCEALGAETVVANLVNSLAQAARQVNPQALAVAWPYSAEHVWSLDRAQRGFIERLQPGGAIFTEIEKDEWVVKPGGVRKHLWDYSIDLIGPGDRAREQVAACRAAGVPIFMKSEPELGFEAARLPHIPSMDRWADRAEALVACGADGAWVFPAFRPLYGTTAAEVNKHFWWDPVAPRQATLAALAARVAGPAAGPQLRQAWQWVSEAIEFSPELPPYYTGPTYLGPAHPMCADAEAALPASFYGLYLFMAEAQDAVGLQPRPTFFTQARGDRDAMETLYHRMESLLAQAAAAVESAAPLVPERQRLYFEAESSAILWFFRTIRTTANFYASCRLRDRLHELAAAPATDRREAEGLLDAWRAVLQDELDNARAAVPLANRDVRLDFYYGSDHTFPHLEEMLAAKLQLLEHELAEVLPAVAQRCGL